MDKFNIVIGLFLFVLFSLTLVFHMLYVKGGIYHIKSKAYVVTSKTSIILDVTPYAAREECVGATGLNCMQEACDYVPLAIEIEKVCGTDNKAWFPIVSETKEY